MTDYAIEVWVGGMLEDTIDATTASTATARSPGLLHLRRPGRIEVRIRRVGGGDPTGDIVEIGLFLGDLEHSSVAFSAAKPVVDSRSPALVAVGAIDPPGGGSIAFYSSQGPTNDGRTKPDMSAPSCVASSHLQRDRLRHRRVLQRHQRRFAVGSRHGRAAVPTRAGGQRRAPGRARRSTS